MVDKQGALAVNILTTDNLILATDTPTLAIEESVETGSRVNGIYLHVEAVRTSATSGVLSNVYMAIWKNPGGNLVMPSPNVIGGSDNKKYVIHQEMIMLEQQGNGNPRTIFNGVIVIPRGYRRFGPNDELSMHLLSPGVTVNYCWEAHYKEFR